MSPGRGTLPNGLQHQRHCQRVAAGGRLRGSAGMSGTGDRWSVSLREPRAPWPCPPAACGDLGQLSGRRAGGHGDKPRGQPRAAILVQPWPWMCPCGSAPVLSIAAQKTCPQGLLRGGGTAHGPHGTGHGPSTMEHQDPLCDLSLPQTGCHQQGFSSLGWINGLGSRPAVWRAQPVLLHTTSLLETWGFSSASSCHPPSRAALAVSSLLAPGAVRWHRTSPRSAPQPREQWVTGKWFYFTTISGGTVIQE